MVLKLEADGVIIYKKSWPVAFRIGALLLGLGCRKLPTRRTRTRARLLVQVKSGEGQSGGESEPGTILCAKCPISSTGKSENGLGSGFGSSPIWIDAGFAR